MAPQLVEGPRLAEQCPDALAVQAQRLLAVLQCLLIQALQVKSRPPTVRASDPSSLPGPAPSMARKQLLPSPQSWEQEVGWAPEWAWRAWRGKAASDSDGTSVPVGFSGWWEDAVGRAAASAAMNLVTNTSIYLSSLNMAESNSGTSEKYNQEGSFAQSTVKGTLLRCLCTHLSTRASLDLQRYSWTLRTLSRGSYRT
jgi:hypothetical protein